MRELRARRQPHGRPAGKRRRLRNESFVDFGELTDEAIKHLAEKYQCPRGGNFTGGGKLADEAVTHLAGSRQSLQA